MIPHFDDLIEPPIIGELYMVRCVLGRWNGELKSRYWPVMGPKHDDKTIHFPWSHYHVNRFFVAGCYQLKACKSPLIDDYIINPQALPQPRLMRRKCLFSEPSFFPANLATGGVWANLYASFSDQQCKRGNGWICPHKGFDLGPMKPMADGYIQCPLHGLMVHAETGVVAHKEMPT